jgi:DNA repair exonuclease SbcCD ATPase subunit
MDFLSIFFVITLAALVGIFLSRPFFETTEKENAQKKIAQIESRRSALLADQERTLASIQELDFDNVLGKIAEEDFHAQRSALLKKGAGLMREIDELEQELAQINLQTAPEPAKSVPVNDADVEAMLLARRRQRQERSGGFCPGCGHPLQKSDKFCPQCGTTL